MVVRRAGLRALLSAQASFILPFVTMMWSGQAQAQVRPLPPLPKRETGSIHTTISEKTTGETQALPPGWWAQEQIFVIVSAPPSHLGISEAVWTQLVAEIVAGWNTVLAPQQRTLVLVSENDKEQKALPARIPEGLSDALRNPAAGPSLSAAGTANLSPLSVAVSSSPVVPDSAADIVVRWEQGALMSVGDSMKVGDAGTTTTWRRPSGRISRALIRMASTRPNGALQPVEQIRVALNHEFGHALGLRHQDDPNHLMFAAPRLTSRIDASIVAYFQALQSPPPEKTTGRALEARASTTSRKH